MEDKELTDYFDNFVIDGRKEQIEYIIATHGHQDHIAGFVGNKNTTGIFDYYKIDTIIDFPKTNKTTTIYNNYINTRDRAVQKGAAHYTALQCFNNEDGAKRKYDLGGGVEMEILYNYYYENNTNDENNNSVCVMFRYGENQFLFTGDLEKEGEEKLVDFYEKNFDGLGHCKIFKAGHHGSYTSTTDKLLKAISPEYVVFTTCAGTSEYTSNPANQFPTQATIDRIAQYTDNVYVTTKIIDYKAGQFESFNGNIIFKFIDGELFLNCSNNNTKLKDSEWFKGNRIIPINWE